MTDRLRVAFFGSPAFAVPCLEVLLADADVRVVVTQPDKPAGRGRHLSVPAVKEVAQRAGVAVLQPPSLRPPKPAADAPPEATPTDPLRELLAVGELDLAVVVAYGKILPARLLALPRLGCWNVHGSLLPCYRGAAPIQHALLDGLRETGVTLMQLDEGMDSGPMLLRRPIAVGEEETSGSLHQLLAQLGAELLREGLRRLGDGALVATPQDEAQATYAPRLAKDAGWIDWSLTATQVRDRVRALDPWPGAFTSLDGEPLKLWRARLSSGRGEPGVVLGADRSGLLVACGEGAVAIGELQLPGRKRLAAAALLAGRPVAPGAHLGAIPLAAE